jgi:hypothetical protein
VKVYTSEDERERLAMQAREVGLSLSAYVHARLFDQAPRDAPDLLGRIADHERRIAALEDTDDTDHTSPEPPPSKPKPEPEQRPATPLPKIASRELPNWKRATDLSG